MGQAERVTYAQLNQSLLVQWTRWAAEGFTDIALLSTPLVRSPPATDPEATEKLHHRVSSLSERCVQLHGHWQRTDPDGATRHLRGTYFLVRGLVLRKALRILETQDLDFVVHAGPESRGAVTFYFRDGTSRGFGPFQPGVLVNALTEVQGEPYTFRGFEPFLGSFMMALYREHHPLLIVDEVEETISIQELALRRYAERFRTGEVTFSGTRFTFRVRQPLVDAQGHPLGDGQVVLHGALDSSGRVLIRKKPETLLGPFPAAEVAPGQVAFLEELGSKLLATLGSLCACGNLTEACDCCEACKGAGTTPGVESSTPCPACAGAGYQPKGR